MPASATNDLEWCEQLTAQRARTIWNPLCDATRSRVGLSSAPCARYEYHTVAIGRDALLGDGDGDVEQALLHEDRRYRSPQSNLRPSGNSLG